MKSQPIKSVEYTWSTIGILIFLLPPLLIFMLGFMYFVLRGSWLSDSVNLIVQYEASHPSLALAFNAGPFLLWLGAFIQLLVAVVRLRTKPTASTPQWLVRKLN